MKKVTVEAPATVANLACGFDVLGLALNKPIEVLTMELAAHSEVSIKNMDDFGLPEDPAENLIGRIMEKVFALTGERRGVNIICKKMLKPGSGLGTSAASASAAAVAANEVFGLGLDTLGLIDLALEGEQFISGSRHADNVAPCIAGGIQLVMSNEPLEVTELDHPELWVSVIYPQITISTAAARQMLSDHLPLKTAIKQWGRVGGLVAGLAKKDHHLIAACMVDLVAEPYRKKLIPGLSLIHI